MTKRRILIGGGVVLVLVFVVLGAVLIGRGGEAVAEDESEPAGPDEPCEFEEGKEYCVNEAGDVYFDTLGYLKKMCETTPNSLSCQNPEGRSKMICLDGTYSGMCTDEDGKIAPGDSIPPGVCADGSRSAPCYPQEKPEKYQYQPY